MIQKREKILVSLSAETQKSLLPRERNVSSSPDKIFDELIETAEKTPNVNERDDLIAMAVLSDASDKESLAGVVDAIQKITDSTIREALLEWLYFRRAKDAATGKRFDVAERLASKVEGLEQRAYLHTEIAKGLLNTNATQTHAREVLDEAIEAGADIIMLDNMKGDNLKQTAKTLKQIWAGKRTFLIESSGGISEENIVEYFSPGKS